MRICVLFGSPRRDGATAGLLNAFLSRFPDAGTTVIHAYEQSVSPCNGCEGCRETGVCVIRDGMDAVNRAIGEAELLVLASPVYYSNLPSPLKCIVDRSLPYFRDSLKDRTPLKKGLALVTAGSSYPGDLGCFERTVRVFFLTRRIRFLGQFSVTGTDGPHSQRAYEDAAEAAYHAAING